MGVRHIPQRTCLGCRQVKPKHELIRIVRTPGGRIEVDRRGKKSGRGAYLCPSPECWRQGFKAGRLAYALRTELTAEDRERLEEFARSLFGGQQNGQGT